MKRLQGSEYTCSGRGNRQPKIELCIMSTLMIWPPTLYAAWIVQKSFDVMKQKFHWNASCSKKIREYSPWRVMVSFWDYYAGFHRPNMPETQTSFYQFSHPHSTNITEDMTETYKCSSCMIITCITSTLCTLIQKASFSSCFIFLGSTSSNRETSDLQ